MGILDRATKRKRNAVSKAKERGADKLAELLTRFLTRFEISSHLYAGGLAIYRSILESNQAAEPVIGVLAEWLRGEFLQLAEEMRRDDA